MPKLAIAWIRLATVVSVVIVIDRSVSMDRMIAVQLIPDVPWTSIPPLLSVRPSTVAPLATTISPPLSTVTLLTVAPASTYSIPPLETVTPLAVPPL